MLNKLKNFVRMHALKRKFYCKIVRSNGSHSDDIVVLELSDELSSAEGEGGLILREILIIDIDTVELILVDNHAQRVISIGYPFLRILRVVPLQHFVSKTPS